jgi:mono/diheme cytochrome c family protein
VKRFAVIVAFVAIGCGGSPRRSETVQGHAPTPSTSEEVAGQQVFMKNCNQCHPLGEGGLGPPINNKSFPTAIIEAKVRTGLGGDMPSFPKEVVSSQELDQLVAYLKVLKSNHQ